MSIKQTRYVDIASAVIARAVTKAIKAGKTLTDVQKIAVQTLLVMI